MIGNETLITSLSLYEISHSDFSDKIKQGAYWEVIKHISELPDDHKCYSSALETFNSLQSEETQFIFAVSALNVFIQNNFTGPLFDSKLIESIAAADFETCKTFSTLNNAMYPLVKCTLLLDLSTKYFESKDESSLPDILFKIRTLYIKQMLLEEKCTQLFEKIENYVTTLQQHSQFTSLSSEVKCKIYIELGFIYLYYEQLTKSRKCMDTAMSLIGFKFHLTGALGKRTKYQQTATAQLRVETIIDQNISDSAPLENEPQAIDLNDDTLLENISFNNENSKNFVSNLTAPFLLHTASLKLQDNSLDEMLREEVIAFIEAIVEGKTFSYCISAHAYFLRSRLEKTSIRRLSRCMEQLEEVVQGFDCKKTCSRTGSLFLSGLPPMWCQQKLLAELYKAVGSHKSALDIYETLQMVEEQITSLIAAGRYEPAEKLARSVLAEKETPKLYCILGDTTQDIEHYEKAWDLSNHTSARAMKSLGYHYFNVKEFPKSLECMLKSLECNYLQAGLWFTAGCTALSIPEYPTAIKCFRESVRVNDESAQAWSNLGAAHERTGEVVKAFNCYKEAVKHSYSDWRIWENYLCTAACVKHIPTVLFAYRRILDMDQKYCDKRILNCLVATVRDDIASACGKQGRLFYNEVLALFKYASSKVTTSFDMWRSYAALHLDIEGKVDVSKGIDYLIKAYHSASLHIEKSFEEFLKCTECSARLHKYIIAEDKESPTYAQHLQSLKTILQILITKGNRLAGTLSDDDDEAKAALSEYLCDANKHLEEVEEAQLYV